MRADKFANLTAAGYYEIIPAGQVGPRGFHRTLHRVVVNQGDEGATVELRHADDGDVIATVDASNPSVGQVYDLNLRTLGLEVEVTGDPDVTVTYS